MKFCFPEIIAISLIRVLQCSSKEIAPFATDLTPTETKDINQKASPDINLRQSQDLQSSERKKALAQTLFAKYQTTLAIFTEKILDGVQNINPNKIFDGKMKKILKEASKAFPENYVDGNGLLSDLKSFADINSTNDPDILSVQEFGSNLEHYFSIYIQISGLMTKGLSSKYFFTRSKTCSCAICKSLLEKLDSKGKHNIVEIDEIFVENRNIILKNIFTLNQYIIKFTDDHCPTYKGIDTFASHLENLLRMYVFLFSKFNLISPKKTKSPEMFKSIFSDIKETINSAGYSLCHYLFLIKFSCNSAANKNAKISLKNELKPIHPLLLEIPGDRTIGKFLELLDNYKKCKTLYAGILTGNLHYVVEEYRLLIFLWKLNKTKNANFKNLHENPKDLSKTVIPFLLVCKDLNILSLLNKSPNVKTTYREFSEVIDQLIYELDSITIEQLEKALEDLLKEYLRGLFKELPKDGKDDLRLAKHSQLFSSNIFAEICKIIFKGSRKSVPKQVLKELEKKFASLRPANNILRDYFDDGTQNLEKFKEILSNTYEDLPLLLSPFLNGSSSLKKKMDDLPMKLNAKNLSYSAKEEGIEKMKIEINEYLKGRTEKENKFLRLVTKAKSLLVEMFKFSSKKDEISQIKIQSPYESEINWCKKSLSKLETLYNDAKMTETKKMQQIDRLEAKKQSEQNTETAEQNTEAGPSNLSTPSSAENKRKNRDECHSSTKDFKMPKRNNRRLNKFTNLNKQQANKKK